MASADETAKERVTKAGGEAVSQERNTCLKLAEEKVERSCRTESICQRVKGKEDRHRTAAEEVVIVTKTALQDAGLPGCQTKSESVSQGRAALVPHTKPSFLFGA